jgi:hypothetical protein
VYRPREKSKGPVDRVFTVVPRGIKRAASTQ